MRQRIGSHRQSAHRVELDAVGRCQVGDRTADDRQPLPGVDRVLPVDVVMAELTAGQSERFVPALVPTRADQIERRLPGVRSRGR